MPVNPMQRRMRNSFLVGFLLALIIMALVVLVLVYKMKGIEEEKAAIQALQQSVYVAAEDLVSGQSVNIDNFMLDQVQTSIDTSLIISEDDFMFQEDGEPIIKYNDDGSEKQKDMVMKVNVPAGAIVTKDMLADSTTDITSDQRIQEFNMILLPSQLKTGDYIDVRLSLPKGQDYIVLAKKKVLQSTETGIWLKLSEEEMLTINNAIVESYGIIGSKLYAIEYSDPGIQEAAEPTYPVNLDVFNLINYNPNIVETAKTEIYNRYYANNQAMATQRSQIIDPAVAENGGSSASNIESRNQEEISKVQSARADYVSTLGE